MKKQLLLAISLLFLGACAQTSTETPDDKEFKPDPNTTYGLVLTSQVKFDQLNPARGDQSPLAGTLYGNRNGKEATGFLFKPVDGFQSPPHIHNVTYKGVVISGDVHNDDPEASNMWLPAGSYWIQPKGAPHITSAKGVNTMAYIEIEEGPYLVKSTEEAFYSGEEPLNVDRSNIVWLDASTIKWIDDEPSVAKNPEVTFLWGNPQTNDVSGRLVKFPKGFKGHIHSQSNDFKAVVIQGKPLYHTPKEMKEMSLTEGSYFSANGPSKHFIVAPEECIIYIRTTGPMELDYSEQN